jgi:hypothetical protein
MLTPKNQRTVGQVPVTQVLRKNLKPSMGRTLLSAAGELDFDLRPHPVNPSNTKISGQECPLYTSATM